MKHFLFSVLMFNSVFLNGYNALLQTSQDYLQQINDLTTNAAVKNCQQQKYTVIPVAISTSEFETWREKAKLAAKLIEETQSLNHKKLVQSSLRHLLSKNSIIQEARVVSLEPFWYFSGQKIDPKFVNSTSRTKAPWMLSIQKFDEDIEKNFFNEQLSDDGDQWTYPYFICDKNSWIISFVQTISNKNGRLSGFLSFDINLTSKDLNQCDDLSTKLDFKEDQIEAFLGSHKCHKTSSDCIFKPGHGWVYGGYICKCKTGYYSRSKNVEFNGTLVEDAFSDKFTKNDHVYDNTYQCLQCQPGCDTCIDQAPCLATYNWTFRYILLAFSLTCIMATFVLIIMVYYYRKLKVFQLGSPAFLCLTLMGCTIMYLEMVAIFPYLEVYSCIATKWTRHMGFLLTYSSLLLKTWRVNLTFRVKSAHKLKLTDKQLLQWLFPILLVMIIYLAAWTLSDPPQGIYILDSEGLKFKQCSYGWWDHSLALGEFLFLMWGIKVCFSVRKARTHYDEAKLITWSIYNIATVNIIMAAIHLILFPNAGPDLKYFFGFLRTQMSTTVTIILVFGPKFLRLVRGTANELDDSIRARGHAASMIEVPLEREASQKDIYVENEELKEEIQKLAGQIEYLKIVGMLVENPHIKPKKDGYFSKENCSKHFHQICHKNGPRKNSSTTAAITSTMKNKSSCKSPLLSESKNGDVRTPTSSGGGGGGGQPVILAERSEEQTYTLIDSNKATSSTSKHQDFLSTGNTKPQKTTDSSQQPQHHQPRETLTSTTSSTGEEVCLLTSNFKVISCETKTFRDVSPSVEPYIPERV